MGENQFQDAAQRITSMNMGLKIIALISGGKDSLFSILHCLANGHEVVALGNLHPKEVVIDEHGNQVENEQDTDSYMYQTIGHSVIELYSDALGIPLYRRPLIGRAVDHSLNYSPKGTSCKERDEAEDLFLLLQDIISKHPEANAVSTGAILSTYQRVRVESVAVRLDLVPLSYLWQYPYLPPHRDVSLLDDMHDLGMDPRLIKVASGGLDEGFLNQVVSDPKTIRRMLVKMRLFEPAVGAILGEGGEFETLALSGPRPLWKKKIILTNSSTSKGSGGSFSLAIRGARTEPFVQADEQSDISSLRLPPLLDSEFHDLITLKESTFVVKSFKSRLLVGRPFLIPNMRSSHAVPEIKLPGMYTLRGEGSNACEQMQDIVAALAISNLASSIISTTLLLSDMSDFHSVNPIYGKLFKEALPPSRVTVAVGNLLPDGCFVVLTIKTSDQTQSNRSGLHVQSRSYWAPANIGQYSQAICEKINNAKTDCSTIPAALVNVAGQIPLVPTTTDLLSSEDFNSSIYPAFSSEQVTQEILPNASVALSLQHLWRIGRATSVKTWTGGLAYINLKSSFRDRLISQAFSQWMAIHNYWVQEQQHDSSGPDAVMAGLDIDTRSKLPDVNCFGDGTSWTVPPCFAILVADLPRGAPIEWWSIGLSSQKLRTQAQTHSRATTFGTSCLVSNTTITWIGITDLQFSEELTSLVMSTTRSTVTIFAAVKLPEWLHKAEYQCIPCYGIWNDGFEDLEALIVLTQHGS